MCDTFHAQGRYTEITVGQDLTAENIVEVIMNSKSNWENITNFITAILKKKEDEEHDRQQHQVTLRRLTKKEN